MVNFRPNQQMQRKNLLKKIIKRVTPIICLKTFVVRRKTNFLKSIKKNEVVCRSVIQYYT